MNVEAKLDQNTVIIQIRGNFNYSLHGEFREAYRRFGCDKRFVIDLRYSEFLDSSALGMLLLLREHVGGQSADVTIVHCNPTVRKILDVANFAKLFKIDPDPQ